MSDKGRMMFFGAVKSTRVPTHAGWFTFARGAMISRRQALRILVFGPQRARIQTWQSTNPDSLSEVPND